MKRGYTVLEVLITAALMLLLTGVLGALLVLGFDTWKHSSARSQAQEQTLLVLALLTTQVRHAQPQSLLVLPRPGPPCHDALTLLSCLGPQGTSVVDPASRDVTWQAHVAVYLDPGTQRVLMQQIPLQPPASDVDPATMLLQAFTPAATDHVTARDVTSLSLTLQQSLVQAVVQAKVGDSVSTEQLSVSPLEASPSPSPDP